MMTVCRRNFLKATDALLASPAILRGQAHSDLTQKTADKYGN